MRLSTTSKLICFDWILPQRTLLERRNWQTNIKNLPLGLTDALVIACAERNGGEVLSLDEHFWIVSGEGKLKMHTLE
jgi:predicted nucleic acid-binding protein